MSWDNSDRRSRLPADWAERRDAVKRRADGRCEAMLHDGSRCDAVGTDCDHRQRGDNHSLENLQWLCPWHHKRKTRSEALEALSAIRHKNMPKQQSHPGLIDPTSNHPATGDPPPHPPEDLMRCCRFLFVRVWGFRVMSKMAC